MKQVTYILFILTVLVSCQEDLTTSKVIVPEMPTPSISVESSIVGRVVDIGGNPLANTEIILAGETRLTSELGYFQFDRATLDRYGSLLTARKSGYLTGFRRVSLHAGTSNFVEFTMLSDAPGHSFDSSDGATIQDDNGVSLSFSKNSVSLVSGQAYDGVVNVSVQYIDPSASNIISTLPGSLQGFTSDGVLSTLRSYSMISVELTNDEGEELQIKESETVDIEFPVAMGLLNNAPNEIPLWYLDEQTGLWMEEGQAVLVDDVYIGEVSHFSYWNCDVPTDFVIVEGSVCNTSNGTCDVLSFSEIAVFDSNNEVISVSKTDSDGNFTFFIPKNTAVTIDFVSMCDDVNDLVNISPTEEDQNLGQIEINSGLASFKLDVDILNCEGSPLDNGTLLVNNNNYVRISNGQISETIAVCGSSDITIQAFDSGLTKSSAVTSLGYAENITANLSLCEDVNPEDTTIVDFVRVSLVNDEEEIAWSYLDASFTECNIYELGNPSPSPEFLNINHVSLIGTDYRDSSYVFLEFDNGTSCDPSITDVNLASVEVKLRLTDNNYYIFGAYHPDIYFRLIPGYDTLDNSEIDSYGQNTGDIISGSITVETATARLDDFLFDNETEHVKEGVVYTMIVDYRITVK